MACLSKQKFKVKDDYFGNAKIIITNVLAYILQAPANFQ